MLGISGRSYKIHHVLILQFFNAPKKLHFWQNHEKIFNQRNFVSWVKLNKVTYKGHISKVNNSKKDRIWNNSLRVKCRYQLIIRLKVNKIYQKLLYYLSFYISLLNIRPLKLYLSIWLVLNLYFLTWTLNFN